jgi:membrane protein DedA with SNARE-associated domain
VYELLNQLGELPPAVVYIVAALLVAGETALIVGLVAPAEATLLLVGFLAYAGTLRLAPTLVIMIAAALVGDALGHRAGRRYGPRLRESRFGRRIGPERWAKADRMLHRAGGRGIFFARWVAFVRTLVPRLAGAAGMPYRRFAPWNAAGVATWVGGSVVIGYLAGASYETVSRYLGKATGAVLLLIASIVVIVLVGRWLGRNPDPAKALLARAGALPPLRWLTQRYGVLFFVLSMHLGAGWALLLNLAAGLALLFVIGLGLSWLMGVIVRQSGLSVVDEGIAAWFAQRRTEGVVDLATTLVSTLRGPVLIAAVGLVAVVIGWRTRAWRRDLVGVVGTVGAFVPLVVLAVVADLTGRDAPVGLLPGQNAVVTASFCTLAWLIGRHSPWPVAVAGWTVAAVGVVTVGGARLYLGWSAASEMATSVLLGVMWTVVFMVAWSTRDRAARARPAPGARTDTPAAA